MVDFLTSRFGLKISTIYKIQNFLYGIVAIGFYLNFGPAPLVLEYSKRAQRLAGGEHKEIFEMAAFVFLLLWFTPVSIIGALFYTIPYFIAQFVFGISFLTAATIEVELRGYLLSERLGTNKDDK